ncbi:tRNA1(Val) (adenine(37)-N6)-methyltransferase [Cyclobacterium xiamenense]|uniref:tRNA1(Val) (adenine(37)-N6)-methyltransferase n=1 Tax=Cyclobacterium xiamenense TaxID=1297121 RepID=UPI0035CF078B
MKLSTDAVILGALAQAEIPDSMLDVGTGTGILALMLAQRYRHAVIDAVELDPEAARQAGENCAASPFANRIRVHHRDFSEFAIDSQQEFDLILSNPPFYAGQLKSGRTTIDLARHELGLDFDGLWNGIQTLLKKQGVFWLILPPVEMDRFRSIGSSRGYTQVKRIQIYDKPDAKAHREVAAFARKEEAALQESMLVLKNASGSYTSEYRELLRGFMLHF